MKLNKEIRIKAEEDIPDNIIFQLVWSVVVQGKISNEGKSYCYGTLFEVEGQQYMVEASDKKLQMFYVYKKESNQ